VASGRAEGSDSEPEPKRRRLPGVTLRPGSVKQARLEAGLSLAQLGKGQVTAPAIYLVETGRTRPSLPTLEHIARRTGKPVEFFLAEPSGSADDSQARLLELEAMVEEGSNDEAIQLGRALLERAPSAFRLGRIRYLLAQAYVSSGQADLALPLFAEARAHFEAVGDGVMLAACLGAVAAIALRRQPAEAVTIAEQALAVARGLSPVPMLTEAHLMGVLGDAHAANKSWELAIACYEEAVKLGSTSLDLRRAGRTYRSAGLAYHDAGELEKASRFAMRSVALLEVVRDREALARYENGIGLAHMARGDFAEARRHFDRSLEICEQTGVESGRSSVVLSQCELAMREGDLDRAGKLGEEALELAERLEEGVSAAEAHVWLGRVADARGVAERVDREFTDAIASFEALGMHERLLQTHGAYAEILERRGDLNKAYVHMKEALQASRPDLLRRATEEERVSSA
jgi:tetratricopeptide (TPR) repeat protein